MTRGRKSQSRKINLFNWIKIAYKGIQGKFFEEKDSFGKIYNIKEYYQKLDFGSSGKHVNNACHHERKQKYFSLAKDEESTRI